MTSLRETYGVLNWHLGRARYLFIHIPKNAGVSLRKTPALASKMISADPYFHKSHDYTRAVAHTMHQNGEHHGFQHARWRDVHPKVTAQLAAVGVIRNPWARTLSRWRFADLIVRQGKVPRSYSSKTFEEFLEERHEYGDRPYYWHRAIRGWYPQFDYVTDDAGNLRVELLRFEFLGVDSMRYFGLNTPPRSRNSTSNNAVDYRHFYTSRTIQIVADWYKKDIETFGFDFDGPATRNVAFLARPKTDCPSPR